MALSLDDKLLGEKVDNYCSSSEDEDDRDSGQSADEEAGQRKQGQTTFIPEPAIQEYGGSCTNTGPKGVINDWREFKRLETEAKTSQERERQRLMNKLSLTCRSYLDDEREKQKDAEFEAQIDDLEEDDFLKEYRQKRIEEMRRALDDVPKFGTLIALEKNNFIDAIDKEKPCVKIVVHVYEDNVRACEAMNGSLICLSREYQTIKFCKIKASDAKLSRKFSVSGVPALLVYQQGELISNFVRLSDELGEDFYAIDVESYLQEHGIMPSTDIMKKIVRDRTTGEIRGSLPQDDDDSDFELD